MPWPIIRRTTWQVTGDGRMCFDIEASLQRNALAGGSRDVNDATNNRANSLAYHLTFGRGGGKE